MRRPALLAARRVGIGLSAFADSCSAGRRMAQTAGLAASPRRGVTIEQGVDVPAGGRRISWQQVPDRVRGAVEATLGTAVVETRTQVGGFSPGCAARLRLANGGTALVKALGVDVHRPSVGLYRSEAAVMPHLPAGLPVPRLLDVYDDGEWVALVYEEVDGRQPAVPWRSDELERVAAALADLGAALDPSPWPDAPTFADVNAGVIQAWRGLAMAPPPDLDSSVR